MSSSTVGLKMTKKIEQQECEEVIIYKTKRTIKKTTKIPVTTKTPTISDDRSRKTLIHNLLGELQQKDASYVAALCDTAGMLQSDEMVKLVDIMTTTRRFYNYKNYPGLWNSLSSHRFAFTSLSKAIQTTTMINAIGQGACLDLKAQIKLLRKWLNDSDFLKCRYAPVPIVEYVDPPVDVKTVEVKPPVEISDVNAVDVTAVEVKPPVEISDVNAVDVTAVEVKPPVEISDVNAVDVTAVEVKPPVEISDVNAVDTVTDVKPQVEICEVITVEVMTPVEICEGKIVEVKQPIEIDEDEDEPVEICENKAIDLEEAINYDQDATDFKYLTNEPFSNIDVVSIDQNDIAPVIHCVRVGMARSHKMPRLAPLVGLRRSRLIAESKNRLIKKNEELQKKLSNFQFIIDTLLEGNSSVVAKLTKKLCEY
jgi:hypothetical protein